MTKGAAADLILVKLNEEQIRLAKQANGPHKPITHALLCGRYGQRFGTELQCRPYFTYWQKGFESLFRRAYETDSHEIRDYRSTIDLVSRLIEENQRVNESAR